MKDEYDFTGAERERFFRKDAELMSPVHLDADIMTIWRTARWVGR